MATARDSFTRAIKSFANVAALAIAWPAAASCWLEAALHSTSEGMFVFWTQVFAIMPGHVGLFLRRAFYRLTLDYCDAEVFIGFGALFSHRGARVEPHVYVGSYAVIGSARLRRGCLIGTRASLLSGGSQHTRGPDGSWISDGSMFRTIEIGKNAWIGEAATVMADVGDGAIVAAGSVVSMPLAADVVVAGNPARLVRRSEVPSQDESHGAEVALSEPTTGRIPALDWMKCLGMTLIVYGHVAGWAPLATLRPIRLKQLGVAFFLFSAGFSLARESRGPLRVVFNRLFALYLFGIPIALLLSLIAYPTVGRVLLSNYAPFVGGANVVFDFFPANPTSWYVGTYIHALLLWAILLRRTQISAGLVILVGLFEIGVRAVLMNTAGLFVAYMLLTNWLTVLLLGIRFGQRRKVRLRLSAAEAGAAALLLLAAFATWATFSRLLPFQHTFPFSRLRVATPFVSSLAASAMITALYLAATPLVFAIVEPLGDSRFVRFIARNTVIIFLGHMPVYYAAYPVLAHVVSNRALRSALLMLICLPGLGLLSEVVQRVVNPRVLRDLIFTRLAGPQVAASHVEGLSR